MNDRLVKFVENLVESAKRTERFRAMTNEELADLLQNKVWAEVNIFSHDSDLLGVIIDRLRGEE